MQGQAYCYIAYMGRISRWLFGSSDATASPTKNKYANMPIFPWEMTTAEYISKCQDSQDSSEPELGFTSPYALHAILELQAIEGILRLDRNQPLASILLSFPSSREKAKTDNYRLDRQVNKAIQAYENRNPQPASPLLLDCHVTDAGLFQWNFRPAGSSKQFSKSWARGRGLAGEVEDTTRRLVCLIELEVSEGPRGPEVRFTHHKSFDPYQFDSLTIPVFPGLTTAQSMRLSVAIENLLNNFKFSMDDIEEYIRESAEYIRHLSESTVNSGSSSGTEEVKKRWGQFVNTYYPGASVPDTLLTPVPDHVGSNIILPAPRLIRTPRDAEEYAAEAMSALGLTNVTLSPEGPDGGVDVSSDEALAQVKLEGRNSTREQLQRLTGIALTQGTSALFFSLAGYTQAAVEWAEATNMALFTFAYDGSLAAESTLATDLLSAGSSALDHAE